MGERNALEVRAPRSVLRAGNPAETNDLAPSPHALSTRERGGARGEDGENAFNFKKSINFKNQPTFIGNLSRVHSLVDFCTERSVRWAWAVAVRCAMQIFIKMNQQLFNDSLLTCFQKNDFKRPHAHVPHLLLIHPSDTLSLSPLSLPHRALVCRARGREAVITRAHDFGS